jgi:hypothetical protein
MIIKFHFEGSILLYPNPSENYINIDFQNPVEGKIIYSIIDLNGKVLIHEEEQLASDFQHKIDLSLVEAGFYRVDITTEKGKIQKSFVKN